MIEYNVLNLNIINIEPDTSNLLEMILMISELIINLSLIAGGAYTISRIKRLRIKRDDAIFSFLQRLQIRVRRLNSTFKNHKEYLLDSLIVPTKRSIGLDAPNSYIDNLANKFSKDASETITFLMNENDQIPLYNGWTEQCKILIEFLEAYSRIEDKNYFLWTDDQNKESFFKVHSENMDMMIEKINARQLEIEEEINKERLNIIKKVKRWIDREDHSDSKK